MVLSDEICSQLCDAAKEKADELGVDISFAICDEYGYPLLFRRFEGAFIFSTRLVPAKAYTAAIMEMPTKVLSKLAKPGGPLDGIQHQDSQLTLVSGGYPLYIDGKIAGGIGVGGGIADEDSIIAEYVLSVFSNLTK